MGPRDTNADGKLSQDEFLSQQIKRFKNLDTNNDGFVTESEMSARSKANAASAAKQISPEQKQKMKARRAKMKAQREKAAK